MTQDPQLVLKKYFDYDTFRPGQLEIVKPALAGKDVLGILPTGAGKSVCFQVPGLCLGPTIVVCPLIALMQDQVERLQRYGVRATAWHSQVEEAEVEKLCERWKLGGLDFLYVAPERLKSAKFVEIVHARAPALIVIDEAHCISAWGHEFRPSYRLIGEWLKSLSKRPVVLALTATATPQVIKDIESSLSLHLPVKIRQTAARKNLWLTAVSCESTQLQRILCLRAIFRHPGKTGIIYHLTREGTIQTKEWLRSWGVSCEAYHGGMSPAERVGAQTKFMNGEVSVMAATNAFGMGIDKSNIRFVIHIGYPANIENYWQEAGRAGRDGELSWCYLLAGKVEFGMHQQRALSQSKGARQKVVLEQLKNMDHFGKSKNCLAQEIQNYFGERGGNKCGRCDRCCKPLLLPSSEELKRFQGCRKKVGDGFPDSVLDWLAVVPSSEVIQLQAIPGLGFGRMKKMGEVGGLG